MDDKSTTKTAGDGLLPWIQLDKNTQASDSPDAIWSIQQQNEICMEIVNGNNQWGNVNGFMGGFFSFFILMFLFVLTVGTFWDAFLYSSWILFIFVLPLLIFDRKLHSNIRINRKTKKLYAVDRITHEPIEAKLEDIEVQKFQNLRASGRGVSSDFNLAFSGKDEQSNKAFSLTTPVYSSEKYIMDNWEYFRRYMKGVPLSKLPEPEDEFQFLGKSFSGQMKKHMDYFYPRTIGSLTNNIKLFISSIKSFKPLLIIGNFFYFIVPIVSISLTLFRLPGILLETWAFFYWKKRPTFSKENDELCGFTDSKTKKTT